MALARAVLWKPGMSGARTQISYDENGDMIIGGPDPEPAAKHHEPEHHEHHHEKKHAMHHHPKRKHPKEAAKHAAEMHMDKGGRPIW